MGSESVCSHYDLEQGGRQSPNRGSQPFHPDPEFGHLIRPQADCVAEARLAGEGTRDCTRCTTHEVSIPFSDRTTARTPPISDPQTSSSELNTLLASVSYSLFVHGPRPGTSSSPWKPVPYCRSKSRRLFSSRFNLRNLDRSQSSQRRKGIVVPSNMAVLSSIPFDRNSPSTRLHPN